MKTSKNKRRRRQQQRGRPVLLTFYVIQPTRVASGTRATSPHNVRHHQHRQHQQHVHSGGHDERRRANGGKFPKNRRADLLEYSRKLRALSRHVTTTASTPPLPPLPAGRQHYHNNTAVAVRGEEGQPTAIVNRRLERAMSQQQIRQRCFGRDGWSWKRVLVLIFPSNSDSVVGRSKPRRPRRMDDDDSEKNPSNNQKGWPAALLAGKLTVTKSRRDHSGFAKKLMSVFQKQPQ
ncbi:unnamed protein product [Urochloa decumbens]|uniref:Uncharacterized protein n=1 Tax=Urochloa decumbens TaxID=240449 RepID=A0ABC8ZRA4_9POAL